jgi:phospholipid-binding lipoprotein MlaA
MKILINLFVTVAMATSFSGLANASNKIRLINIDSSKLEGDYDKALETDPWKGFNLAMFKFNNGVDQYFLEPIARSYRAVTPQWGRNRISDFFNNLGETTNFANSILQGDVEGAFRSFWRVIINTGFGIGGLHDVASGFGLKEKEKDFSQTLAIYGLNTGPYLVVPFMGPSTARDFFGDLADKASEPSTYIDSTGGSIAVSSGDIIQTREGLIDVIDDAKKNSFDLYSTYKSGYLQRRQKQLVDTAE